jgi:glycine/D-amino acid oxidase-like deaminating enzyme
MSSLEPRADHPSVVELLEKSALRFPFVRPDLPMTLHTGIMSFAPDGDPLLGEIPGVGGLYHCAGFGGHGVVQSPAIGLAMAELILDGTWRYNPDELEADRFFDLPEMRDRGTVKARCLQVYADYYSKLSTPGGKH